MRRCDRDVAEVQVMAADHDLVPVGQRAPLDALAVDEHAVEAAVVDHAQAVGLAHDQRVPARHRRIIEADVSRQAAADPGPLALERECGHVPVVATVREVLARDVDPITQLRDPILIGSFGSQVLR